MIIDKFFEVQQDTLVLPQQQTRPLPTINVRKPQIDLERAEEIIRQLEQREQEIIQSQQPVVKPRPKPVEVPIIKVDTLLLQDTIPVITIVPPSVRTEFSSEARKIDYPSSITVFIIFGLALLTIIKYNFGKNLLEVIKSFFNYRQAMRMLEERRESDRLAAFLSNTLFALSTGIFVSITIPFFGASLPWGSYTLSILFFSAAIACLYILKAWIWNLLGIVFIAHTFSKIYIYNMFLYNRNIGLMIFPFVAILPFVTAGIAPYIVYIVFFIVTVLYFFKLIRIFQIIHGLNVSAFYFILYLCTFEILPLLLLIKGCKMLWEFNLFE